MERNSGSRHSRPEISEQAGYAEVGKVMATARSRSPSRERHGDSRRQYRQRSPSRAEKRTHDEDRNDREDGHSHRSRPSRHHDSHRRPRRDGDRDSERQRHSHHRSRHGHGSKKRSPSPVRTNDHSDDRRDVASQSGSRYYGNTHECIDSTLKRQHSGAVTLPPTPKPPTTHTARVPPPEAERHYTSHRCHHHSHNDHDRDTVSRSTTARSQHHQPRPPSPPPAPVKLPFGARALSRWDFAVFEPLFAHYLELQNNVRLADLDEDAVRDRWKVFVSRWNGGELDSRWYEPEMFLRVVRLRATEEARVRAAAAGNGRSDPGIMTPPMTGASFAGEMVGSVVTDRTGITKGEETAMDDNAEEDDEDDYAPPLPPPLQLAEPPGRMTAPTTKPGPAIPNLQDLELRRSLQVEAEEDRLASLRLARRADRDQQKERIEELAPRAEPGSRERKLEKRQVTTDVMRQFASAREAGDMEEVGDKELIGGGDGADDYRRMLANLQKKKTDREVRREEIVRAKNAERDERLREYRTREEGTVEMLREMARQRFG
jgi:hypothetical protein